MLFCSYTVAQPSFYFTDTALQECVDELVQENNWQTIDDITYITCENKQITYIDGIEQLPNLSELTLSDNQLVDVFPLNQLYSLRKLILSGNRNIQIEGLLPVIENNPELAELGLGGIRIADETEFFQSLLINAFDINENIVALDLSRTGIIETDLLAHFPNLMSLDLSDNGIEFILGIDTLPLRELDLSNNQLSLLYGMDSFSDLRVLNLSGNHRLAISDVLQLILQNPELTELGVGDIAIDDYFLFFQTLMAYSDGENEKLTYLDLSNTGLENTYNLMSFAKLRTLNLSNNSIDVPVGLRYLTFLKSLNLSSNELGDISQLQMISGLTSIDLSGNSGLDADLILPVLERNSNTLEFVGVGDIAIDNHDDFLAALLFNSTTGDNQMLTGLDLSNTGMEELHIFDYFPQLKSLDLSDNAISDTFPLQLLEGLQEIDLSGNQLMSVDGLTQFTQLTKLKLSGNGNLRFDDIFPLVANNPNLVELGVGGIAINDFQLFFDAFAPGIDGFNRTLRWLDLSETGLDYLYYLYNFVALEYLDVSGNALSDIDGYLLQNMPQLYFLDISDNQIESLFVFEYLENLTALDISGNDGLTIDVVYQLVPDGSRLTHLGIGGIAIDDVDVLWNFLLPSYSERSVLTALDLSHQGLSTYDIDILASFTRLKRLDLRGNAIEQTYPLQYLLQLEYLDLSDNALLEVASLWDLEQLTYFSVSDNNRLSGYDLMSVLERNSASLEFVGAGDIAIDNHDDFLAALLFNSTSGDNQMLTGLDLSNTGMEELHIFDYFPQLESLDLSDNAISDTFPLQLLEGLQEIDLSGNQLMSVEGLTPFTQLTQLKLSGNGNLRFDDIFPVVANNPNLVELGVGGIAINDFQLFFDAFAPGIDGFNRTLRWLDLSETGLDYLYYLHNLVALEYLDVSGNALSDIDGYVLQNMPQLYFLDISDNQIENLFVFEYLENLTALDISGNDGLTIDVVYQLVPDGSRLTHLGIGGIAIDDVDVLWNFLLPGYSESPVLTALDLSHQGLSTYDIDILASFTRLKRLDLRGNAIEQTYPLQYLLQLEYLDLSDNALSEVASLWSFEQLTYFSVSGNNRLNGYDLMPVLERNSRSLEFVGAGDIAIDNHDDFLAALLFNSTTGDNQMLTGLDLSNTGMEGLHIFDYFPQLESLDLSDNAISDTFPLQFLEGLQEIDLSENQLISLNGLTQLNQLTRFNVSGNGIVYTEDLRPILENNGASLEVLGLGGILTENHVDVMSWLLVNTEDGFARRLRELDLSNTRMEAIGFLDFFPNIEVLDLSNNALREDEFYPGFADNLREIDLSNNQLNWLTGLTQFTGLRKLNLSGNNSLVFENVFPLVANNPNITDLGLGGIAITDFQLFADAFSRDSDGRNTTLAWLDLSGTGLEEGFADFLSDFVALEYLDISDNSLNYVNGNIFLEMSHLSSLDLSDNHIEHFFSPVYMENLTALDISGNETLTLDVLYQLVPLGSKLTTLAIGDIHIDSIDSLFDFLLPDSGENNVLSELDLSNLNLTSTDIDILSAFLGLKDVNLSGNTIDTAFALENLSRLQSIDLSNNALIEVNSLWNQQQLMHFSVSGNSNLNIDDILPILENNGTTLETLGLGNIFISDLQGVAQSLLINSPAGFNQTLKKLDLSGTGLNEFDFFWGFHILESLDLSDNDIETVPILDAFYWLKEINLNNNRLISLDGLNQFTELTQLNLSGNSNLWFDDIATLINNNSELVELGVGDIHIVNFSELVDALTGGFGENAKLTYLDVSGTSLSEIYQLENIPNLKTLDLADNQIDELSPLFSLYGLEELDLAGNAGIICDQLYQLTSVLGDADINSPSHCAF